MLFRTRQICLKKRKIKQRLQIPKEKKSRPTWPKTTNMAKGKKGMVFLDQRLALVNEWISKTSRCLADIYSKCLIGKSHFDDRSPQRPWQSWQTCFRRCDCGAYSNVFQMFVTSVVFTFKLFSLWFKRWSPRTWLRTRGPKSKQGKPYQHWSQQVTQHQHRNQNCSFLKMISREIATRIKIPFE